MGPLGDLALTVAEHAGNGGPVLAAALRGLRQVAEALGVFEQTRHAHSLSEAAGMLVAEIARRDTLAGTAAPGGGGGGGGSIATWQPTTGQLATMHGLVAELPGNVDLAAIVAWAGIDTHEPLCTQGRTDVAAVAGYPATTHHPGGSAVVGIAMHAAPAGGQVAILLGHGPVPSPGPPPSDALGSRTWSGREDAPKVWATTVYDELVTEWRANADAQQVQAGELPPSQAAAIARLRGAATALYAAANQLADMNEPLRTGEEHEHVNEPQPLD